jgi:hypothetical protein
MHIMQIAGALIFFAGPKGGSMAECNFVGECAFYKDQLPDMPLTKDFLKDMYCLRRPLTCLRLKQADQAPVDSSDNRATPLIPDSSMPDRIA